MKHSFSKSFIPSCTLGPRFMDLKEVKCICMYKSYNHTVSADCIVTNCT